MGNENGKGNGGAEDGLIIIWHSRTGGALAMAEAAFAGARSEAPDVACSMIRACDALPDHIARAAAIVFVCPENLASCSGEMKECLDVCYYPLLGCIEGKAYATAIAAGSDGTGATAQIDRIATGWRLRRVAAPLICNFDAQTPEAITASKTLREKQRKDCFDLGAALAAGIDLGIM